MWSNIGLASDRFPCKLRLPYYTIKDFFTTFWWLQSDCRWVWYQKWHLKDITFTLEIWCKSENHYTFFFIPFIRCCDNQECQPQKIPQLWTSIQRLPKLASCGSWFETWRNVIYSWLQMRLCEFFIAIPFWLDGFLCVCDANSENFHEWNYLLHEVVIGEGPIARSK